MRCLAIKKDGKINVGRFSFMPLGALSDLKVLECGHFITGPYCAKLLADLGAEVIKIEEPGIGEEARRYEPFLSNVPHPEKSGLFLYLNTNKLGITLDLKKATGIKIFKELVKDADILVENNPPGVMSQLGLDYQTLAKINPQLIMTSVTPFGQSGPYRDYKAHDLNLWHMGGMGYITREVKSGAHPGPPAKGGGRQADFTAGLTAAVAIMCAMYSRQTTGVGQWIDVSELESVASMPQAPIAFPQLEDRIVGVGRQALYPGGLMACKDGDILVGLVEERQWQNLFEMMGNPEWAEGGWWMDRQARVDNAEFLTQMIKDWLKQHTREELLKAAQAKHVPLAVPNSAKEVVEDKQFAARQFFVEIEHPEAGKFNYPSAGYRFSRTPWRVRQPAPLLGEHNEEVYCQRLGYTKEDLAKMRECGAI